MKSWIFTLLILTLGFQAGFAQQKKWESDKTARITSPRIQDLIKNSNLSATNFDNDDIADIVTLGRELSMYVDSFWYFKVMPSINIQPEIVSCLDYHKVLPSSFGNFEIQDQDLIFLGFAEQPLKAQSNSPYNDAVLGVQNNGRIIAIIIAEFPSQGEASFAYYDAATPYIYLSSGDYDDDGRSEFLIYDPDSRKLQLWGY